MCSYTFLRNTEAIIRLMTLTASLIAVSRLLPTALHTVSFSACHLRLLF